MKAAIENKKAMVNTVAENIKTANSFVIFEYTGLVANEIADLRKKLHKGNAQMSIYKNNILKRAMQQSGHENFLQWLVGQNAIIFGFDNPFLPLQEISKVFSDDQVEKIKIGFVNGQTVDKKAILRIAKLPSKEVLISQFLSLLQFPVRKFLAVLSAVKNKK